MNYTGAKTCVNGKEIQVKKSFYSDKLRKN